MKDIALVNLGETVEVNLRKLCSYLNSVQSELKFRRSDSLPNIHDPEVEGLWFEFDTLFEQLRSQRPLPNFDFVVGITSERVTDSKETSRKTMKDYFSLGDGRKVCVVTEAMFGFAPPRKNMYQFLAYLIMCEILIMMSKQDLSHGATRGCLFDDCADFKSVARGMNKGFICQQCLGELKKSNIPEETIEAVQKTLKWCKKNSAGASAVSTIRNPAFSGVFGAGVGGFVSQYLLPNYWVLVLAPIMFLCLALYVYYREFAA